MTGWAEGTPALDNASGEAGMVKDGEKGEPQATGVSTGFAEVDSHGRTNGWFQARRLVAAGLWTAAALWICWLGLLAIQAGWGEDVPVFWAAAQALLNGANPYIAAELLPYFPERFMVGDYAVTFSPYLNPPWAALLVLPAGLLPLELARPAWVLLSLAIITMSTAVICRLSNAAWFDRTATLLLPLMLIATTWLSLACLVAGQLGGVVLAGLVMILVAVRAGSHSYQRSWELVRPNLGSSSGERRSEAIPDHTQPYGVEPSGNCSATLEPPAGVENLGGSVARYFALQYQQAARSVWSPAWLIGPAVVLLALKPQITFPILLAVFAEALWRRRWQWLASIALAGGTVLLLSTALLPTWLPDFLATDFNAGRGNTTTTGETLLYGTASFDSWVNAVFGLTGPVVTAGWIVFGGVVVATAVWLWWLGAEGRLDRATPLAFAVCAGLLLTPYARQYDYAILALPLVVTVTGVRSWRQGVVVGAGLLVMFILALRGGTIGLAYTVPLVLAGLTLVAAKGSRRGRAVTGLRKPIVPRTPSWPECALPVALLALGAGMRFIDLAGMSYWYDEAASVLLASLDPTALVAATAGDVHPPLYYLLILLWMTVGHDEFVLRWLSVAFGIVSLALLYAFGRVVLGRWPATVALALAALSPFAIYYAREIRQYSLLSAVLLLAMWLAWRLQTQVFWRNALGLAIAGGAALYLHVLAGLSLVAVALLRFIPVPRRVTIPRRAPGAWDGGLVPVAWRAGRREPLLFGLVVGGAFFLPWLVFLPQQLAYVDSSFWVAAPSPLAPLITLYAFLFAHTLRDGWLAAGMAVTLSWLALTLLWVRHSRPPIQPVLMWLIVLVVTPPLLALAASAIRPIYLDRTLIGASWPLYLLLGWGLVRAPRPLGLALGATVLVLLSAGLVNFYTDASYGRPPLKQAAAYLAEHRLPGDHVLHTSDGSYYPFTLYGIRGRLVAGDPEYIGQTRSTRGSFSRVVGTEPIDPATLPPARTTWLIVLADHSVDWQWEEKARIDRRLGPPIEIDIGGIRIFRYGAAR